MYTAIVTSRRDVRVEIFYLIHSPTHRPVTSRRDVRVEISQATGSGNLTGHISQRCESRNYYPRFCFPSHRVTSRRDVRVEIISAGHDIRCNLVTSRRDVRVEIGLVVLLFWWFLRHISQRCESRNFHI